MGEPGIEGADLSAGDPEGVHGVGEPVPIHVPALAEVSDAAPVTIDLGRVGHEGAVVAILSDEVEIVVQTRRFGSRILDVRTAVVVVVRIPRVADPVPIGIRTVGKGIEEPAGTVVAPVEVQIEAQVRISRVRIEVVIEAVVIVVVVAGIDEAVPIGVEAGVGT